MDRPNRQTILVSKHARALYIIKIFCKLVFDSIPDNSIALCVDFVGTYNDCKATFVEVIHKYSPLLFHYPLPMYC